MKKGFFKRLAVAACIGVGCMGLLTACGGDPSDPTDPTPTPTPPETNTYTLIFDADNDASTQNVTKTIEKTALDDKSEWPAVEDKDGYAGEWIVKEKVGDTYTLIANHGDGSMQDPYLVKNETQFKKMADSVSLETQAAVVKYYKNGTESTIDDYDTKVTTTKYATVEVDKVETGGVTSWQYRTNKQYFRLVDDINFSDVTIDASGYSSIELDGAKYNTFTNAVEGEYSLNNVSPEIFTDGNMFNVIVDAKYANFNVNLDQKVVNLAFYTSGGLYNKDTAQERRDHTQFINLKVDSNGAPVEIDQNSNNKSSFISHIMHDASFTMKDCEVNITKINSRSSWSGVFVGGYPKTNGAIKFENCINNADVTATGYIGLFFGNDTHKTNGNPEENITIVNCKNSGVIIGCQNSHILAPFINSGNKADIDFDEDETKAYDNNVEGQFEHIGEGCLTTVEFQDGEVDGNSIVLPYELLNLESGVTYTVLVSIECALGKVGDDGVVSTKNGSFSPHIGVEYELNIDDLDEENFVIEDVYFNVTDVTTYCEEFDVDAATIDWQTSESCQYYFDVENGFVVVNSTQYRDNNKDTRFIISILNGNDLVSMFTVPNKLHPSKI